MPSPQLPITNYQLPRRILILSASAGAGHVRAADALLHQFQSHPALADGGRVEHWDILKYTTALFRTLYSKVYLDLINRAPWLLGMAYSSTDKPWKETFAQAFEHWNAAPFIKALRAYNPDLIVATHFTPPNIISWLNAKKLRGERQKISAPAIVVTDLDLHAMWLTRSYSRYFVSLPETEIYLQQMGIPADRITMSGIPIDAAFRMPADKSAARRTLRLDPHLPTLLVSAGGFGASPVETLLSQLRTLRTPAQIVAIAGRNEALQCKLEKLAAQFNTPANVEAASRSMLTLHVVGFTTQMADYMAAADVLLSKPGGLTTAEAMARHLPMCIIHPIPGQEERNADHLLETGVAIKCNNPPTLAWKLDELLADPARLEGMRRATEKLAHPCAAETIVRTLMV